TYLVISTRDGYPYADYVGAVDVLGLDVYVCLELEPTSCRFDKIDRAIAEADAAAVPRYFAVMQDFADSWYRIPTPAEMQAQFDHWGLGRIEGYMIYHWGLSDVATSTAKQDAYKVLNPRSFCPCRVTCP